MKRLLMGLVAFGYFMLFADLADAQPFPVGTCKDVNGTLEIVETVKYFPNGSINKITQFVRPTTYGPPEVYASIPDRSGIHLVQLKSASAGVAFWLARNGNLVASTATGWGIVGKCAFYPEWAAQFPPPAFLPFHNTVPFVLSQEVISTMPLATPAINANIPVGIFQSGTFPGVLPLMSLEKAEECHARAGDDPDEMFLCGVEMAMGTKERAAAECVRSAEDEIDAGLCLLGSQLPAGQRESVQSVADCYKVNGTDWSEYPMCMAEKQAGPQTARLINCARQQLQQGQQPDYWTLGYCAFGNAFFNPNAESAITIQCAIATRGQPAPFAACAGGQLLYRELDKCLKDGIGGDHGCFGKNNSLTKAYDRIEDELRHALGANSVAFKAWEAARLNMDPHKMAEAARKVREELGKAITNGSAAAKQAGRDAKEWIDAATPDITVSPGGIKIEGVKVGQIGKGLKCCKF